jgi:hypothetical protein
VLLAVCVTAAAAVAPDCGATSASVVTVATEIPAIADQTPMDLFPANQDGFMISFRNTVLRLLISDRLAR